MPFKTKYAWNILWPAIRNADLVLEVLDARNPQGTRSPRVESYIKEQDNKWLMLVLNKIDLVPKEVVLEWQKVLKQDFPTYFINALHPSNIIDFIQRIKEMLKEHPLWTKHDVKLRVLIIGYPNLPPS